MSYSKNKRKRKRSNKNCSPRNEWRKREKQGTDVVPTPAGIVGDIQCMGLGSLPPTLLASPTFSDKDKEKGAKDGDSKAPPHCGVHASTETKVSSEAITNAEVAKTTSATAEAAKPNGAAGPALSAGTTPPSQTDGEHCETEEKNYIAARRQHYASSNPEGGRTTSYHFYTPGTIDLYGLWAWPVLTSIWMLMLPYGLPEMGLLGYVLSTLRILGVPFYGTYHLVRFACSIVVGYAPPEATALFGTCCFLGLVGSLFVGRYCCKKGSVPCWDAWFRCFVCRQSMIKVLRVMHIYTCVAGLVSGNHDTRPDSNARGTLKHKNADYAKWIYCQIAGGRVMHTMVLTLSNESLLQLCANPRIMHLRSEDEVVKAQLKTSTGTMESVNMARNHPLNDECMSAHLEAVAYAFYKHMERKNRHLPF